MAGLAPQIDEALAQVRARAGAYALFSDYAAGRHRLAFATEKFRTAFGGLFRAFADNLCAGVIDALADRLHVTGFAVVAGPEAEAQEVWRVWLENRMDQRAGQIHREAITAGDAYAIIWPGPDGRPIIYPQRAAAMAVGYDEEVPGRMAWAAKAWRQSDGRHRLNLYLPDRIEKWITRTADGATPERASAFSPWEAPGEPWPLPNPYGQVPVFHWANNAGVGEFGRSELADVIPLQDALNKAVADMLVAMEYVALPQRWATGLEVEIDPATGRARPPFVPGVERIWAVAGEDVRFGQFEPARLDQFLAAQDAFRREIAAVSRTPLHQIIPPSGQWPSGEAMRSAEAAFLAKVRDRQIAFGNAWENAMQFALRVAGRPDVGLSCQWEDPTPRNALEQANVAAIKAQVGVPTRQILREFGYSEQEIERMLAEHEASSGEMADKLLQAFESGR